MNKYKIKIKYVASKVFLFAALIFIFSSCSTSEEQTVANFKTLVMADEFNTDGEIDTSLWNYDIGTGDNGWGNNELQYYSSRTENIKQENGYLLITANQEDYNGSSYTSARITTKGKFEQAYGRFEARIRVPYGKGLWPAFWLLGNDSDTNIWPQCGEIDIMEYLGDNPNTIFGTVHGPGYSGSEGVTKDYVLENDRYDTGFHVFGIEWGPDYINYYVDDTLYQQITPADVSGEWVFDHPFYIILNVAVGGNYPGAPNAETIFPQTMLVDYVRVYQQ